MSHRFRCVYPSPMFLEDTGSEVRPRGQVCNLITQCDSVIRHVPNYSGEAECCWTLDGVMVLPTHAGSSPTDDAKYDRSTYQVLTYAG